MKTIRLTAYGHTYYVREDLADLASREIRDRFPIAAEIHKTAQAAVTSRRNEFFAVIHSIPTWTPEGRAHERAVRAEWFDRNNAVEAAEARAWEDIQALRFALAWALTRETGTPHRFGRHAQNCQPNEYKIGIYTELPVPDGKTYLQHTNTI